MTANGYERLDDVPFERMIATEMVAINCEKYVTVFHDRTLPVWIYNQSLGKWIPVVLGTKFGYVYCAAFDHQSDLLYVTRNDEWVAIDIADPSNPVIRKRIALEKIYGDQMVLVGDDIHLFGRAKPTFAMSPLHHVVIDRVSFTFKEPPSGINANHYLTSNAVYLKTRNSVIIFGVDNNARGLVVEYSVATNQCNSFQWVLPPSLNRTFSGVCCSKNEDYMLIFGGESVDGANVFGRHSSAITVCDLKHMISVESAVECPADVQFQAVLLSDSVRDEFLTFGFVRETYKHRSFSKLLFLPHYLIELIAKWVSIEYIHLASGKYFGRYGHFKINLDDILKSVIS